LSEYELMYVLHPRLTDDEINATVERIAALVTDPGGEILSIDRWGRRRLAYPIEGNLEGYYVLSTFNAPATVCAPLENQLNLSEDVLRHLLIRGIIPYDEPPRDERVAPERDRSARPPRDDRSERRAEPDEGDGDGESNADESSNGSEAGADTEQVTTA
jgi:small subunit ribosomal protein S6